MYSITGTSTYEVLTDRKIMYDIKVNKVRFIKVSEFKPLYACVN